MSKSKYTLTRNAKSDKVAGRRESNARLVLSRLVCLERITGEETRKALQVLQDSLVVLLQLLSIPGRLAFDSSSALNSYRSDITLFLDCLLTYPLMQPPTLSVNRRRVYSKVPACSWGATVPKVCMALYRCQMYAHLIKTLMFISSLGLLSKMHTPSDQTLYLFWDKRLS